MESAFTLSQTVFARQIFARQRKQFFNLWLEKPQKAEVYFIQLNLRSVKENFKNVILLDIQKN